MKKTTTLINIFLLCGFLMPVTGLAQSLSLVADYPLIDNLSDITGQNSDMILDGETTPPTPPSQGVELCTNGIYILNPNGQDIQSPIISGFDAEDFLLEMEFRLIALPPGGANPRYPALMGGTLARWIGVLIDQNGRIGLKYNNSDSNNIWSNTFIAASPSYHSFMLRYDHGNVDLTINGISAINTQIPALEPFQNDFNFTTTDFSNALSLNGCIRNLKISSTTLIFRDGFE
ncbi:MAG TPA: hypothetical protein ENJ44_06640 [Oceanospirillales bacterium]|nr:hypothetical protein [Oceanospirillales bacterium]